jgi:hypothetical protein
MLLREQPIRHTIRVALVSAIACAGTAFATPLCAQSGNGMEARRTVLPFLRSFLGAGDDDTHYAVAFLDLNRDRKNEAIVYLSGDRWCGSGGCTMLILARAGVSYQMVTKTTITRLPIRVLKTSTNGWSDLSVRVQGGGILVGYEAVLRFDGSTYPDNPSIVPPEGSTGRAGKSVIDTGSPLFPLKPR